MISLGDLAVIIPVAPQERAWRDLVDDLAELPLDTEILFASPELNSEAPASRTRQWLLHSSYFPNTFSRVAFSISSSRMRSLVAASIVYLGGSFTSIWSANTLRKL